MSAIYGLCFFYDRPLAKDNLLSMERSLDHWNADDKGTWMEGSVGLGHLMLYNTPESLNEKLPISNPEGHLTITADARIDNREDLIARLEFNQADKRLITDSNLILKLYEKFGEDCVKYLVGDFAFAIWDQWEQKLFCARDHIGVKPLFYYEDSRLFAFASEKKALLSIEGVDSSFNIQFFYNQLIWPHNQSADTTLYNKIKRLPPANTLSISRKNNKSVLKRYWSLDAIAEIKLGSKDDYYIILQEHFKEAVKCRIRSAFPVGVELSGGIDSSLITGVAQYFLNQNGAFLSAFSNVLPLSEPNGYPGIEVHHKNIQDVITYNKMPDPVYVTSSIWPDIAAELDFMSQVNDGFEMYYSAWSAPIKKEASSAGVRTLLSGAGGDNMVTTRGKNYILDLLDNKKYLDYLLVTQRAGSKFNKLRPLFNDSIVYLLRSLLDYVGHYSSNLRKSARIYNIPRAYKLAYKDIQWGAYGFRRSNSSYRLKDRYSVIQPKMSLRIEGETRLGYYYRTEPRYPMLDIRLLQFFLSMPNKLKYEGPINRMAVRNALGHWLPPSLRSYDSKTDPIAPFMMNNRAGHKNYLIDLLKKIPSALFVNKALLLNEIESFDWDSFDYWNPLPTKIHTLLADLTALDWLINNKDIFEDLE